MTQLLPQNGREARLLRRMRETIAETTPSESEIIQRLQRSRLRGGSRKLLRRRLAPVASGALMGIFLCGSALAWAFSTGRITIPRRATPSDEAAVSPREVPRAPSSAGHTPVTESTASCRPERSSGTDHEQPVHEQAVHEQPVHEQPVHEQPVHEQPVHEQPVALTREPSENMAAAPQSLRAPLKQNALTARPTTEAGSTSTEDDWIKVATYLRTGDYAAARVALSALIHSNQPDARQAAEILDIQLRLRMAGGQLGDNDRVRIIALSQPGQSPSVRSSALRLLQNYESTPNIKSADDGPHVTPTK